MRAMSKKLFQYAGVAASVVLIAFGIGAIVIGANGHSEVRSDIKREAIVGTPDMTPSAIAKEAKAAGLANVALPTCSVANQSVDTGSRAKCFASYMRIHALEATGGKTYSQMPRYAGANAGAPTNDATKAAKGPGGQPVDNAARNVWVTETALSTALNTSSFAESVSVFAIVMGIALLLTGIGFLLLSTGLLAAAAPALRRKEAPVEGAVPTRPAHVAH
jgi:hypothetical protein